MERDKNSQKCNIDTEMPRDKGTCEEFSEKRKQCSGIFIMQKRPDIWWTDDKALGKGGSVASLKWFPPMR